MSKAKDETCGTCCKGSHRKSFNECNVCACGAPFFSQIVVESNLPSNRKCLIEIPLDFIEDHGHRFDKMDKQVILEEGKSGSVYRVKIGGNNFVGFGFEWKDFAQSHNIKSGQIVVFTLIRISRFLVQIYKSNNPSPHAAGPQIPIEVQQACPVKTEPSSPKVEESDDDDIEVCVPQDWLAAKASRSNLTKPAFAAKVKVESVFPESSMEAPKEPEKHGVINPREQQKSVIIPKLEADYERFKKTCYVRPPVFTTLATKGREERSQASPPCSSSENVDVEGLDQSESSDSDSVWTPRIATLPYVRRRNSNGFRRGSQYETSSDSDIDEEEDDEEEEEVVVNKDERRGKRLISEGSNSIDSTRGKRARPSDVEAESPRRNDVDRKLGTNPLIYEGYMVTKQAEWHPAGTKRGRTYVSKRRSVTEAEKQTTLERARKVHVNNISFLKQLHKDSCYRALKLFPPAPFYRDHMISNTEGSYMAILEDDNGDRWKTRIQGIRMFWKHFSLDHNLEEDDVVVFELVDPRPGSVRFLGHIFRVVDIKKPLTGKKGWALYYDVVEGTKKQYFEERRRKEREEAQRLKMQKKQKQNRKDGSSSSRSLNLPD